jgi:dynein heavy chain 1, cytosolic
LIQIQKIVDEFNFNDFSNLSQWVEDLDERIRGILIKRLEEHVQGWISEFSKYNESSGKLINYKTVLEVKIVNQTIVLDPPISEARAFWYKRFHEQLEIICGLKRVQAEHYEKFSKSDSALGGAGKGDRTYKDLILKMN